MKYFSILLLLIAFSSFGQSDSLVKCCQDRDTIRFAGNLQPFFDKWKKGSDLKIIQLGDSHVQMGYFPQAMQATFKSSGDSVEVSSFWFPYALTGGFNPAGVSVDTVGVWKSSKMVGSVTDNHFALTGHALSISETGDRTPYLAIKLDRATADFQILIETTKNWNFSCAEATVEQKRYSASLSIVTVHFKQPKKQFEVYACSDREPVGTLRVFGFRSVIPGRDFQFQSYGSSGGKYADYAEKCAYCTDQLKTEKPDLLILSLGTNDAHMLYTETEFYNYVKAVVAGIREASPKTAILLTTKPDTFFKNLKPVSEEVVKNGLERVALEYKCALWSLSDVMGGNDSILDWYMGGLASADFMHFTPKGYELQGQLLVEALRRALESQKE
ncbi:MAG TPA: GDSL-type esterase/lipase family protein [Fluviicola sp.]|nr:GDSL-type esterase/lipase family protein [Fluviicola sp.]